MHNAYKQMMKLFYTEELVKYACNSKFDLK